MRTQKTSNAPINTRFFDRLLGRNNEQKEEKGSLATQTSQPTELVLRATIVYEAVPEELTDTIFTFELFVDPVLTKDGQVFERKKLVDWLKLKRESESKCPSTSNHLNLSDLECQMPEDNVLQDNINSILRDYRTARADFLQLIKNGKVTEDNILSYQATTALAVEDFQQTKKSMFDAEIASQLNISYRKSCFPETIESFEDFCHQVPVLTGGNEWIQKSCVSSYTEYTEYIEFEIITNALWNLNTNLIKLNIAITSEPSNQLQTTISQLHGEYQSILANMQSIKQSKISSRIDLDEYHGGSYQFPDVNSATFHQYISLDPDTLEIQTISTDPCLRFPDNSAKAHDAYLYPKDETPVENKMNDAVPQSPQCTCSLFLKMISAVALVANGILLLIVLHTPVGFAAGITSLCVGGLTLFAASREKKQDVHSKAPAAAHLASP